MPMFGERAILVDFSTLFERSGAEVDHLYDAGGETKS